MMISQAVSRMRNEFSDSLNKVIYQHERIILERHGKPIAAILPIAEYERVKTYIDSVMPARQKTEDVPANPGVESAQHGRI
jgi:prevent-host-death family protein